MATRETPAGESDVVHGAARSLPNERILVVAAQRPHGSEHMPHEEDRDREPARGDADQRPEE
jgi:hypothetical protein